MNSLLGIITKFVFSAIYNLPAICLCHVNMVYSIDYIDTLEVNFKNLFFRLI